MMSNEAHFHLAGYVNKQNSILGCREPADSYTKDLSILLSVASGDFNYAKRRFNLSTSVRCTV
jgi:hypothetical protein